MAIDQEILTRIFGTLSFGELGVDGFFLISGYLITKSFQNSRSARGYLLKRVLRIYPGYVIAYLLCVFALGPFVGGSITELSGIRVLAEIGGLMSPSMQGVFPGTPYPALNGSMWTIAYEFRCYLLVVAAGIAGLLPWRSILASIIIGALALSAAHLNISLPSILRISLGDPILTIRFAGVFGCGALYYLYRDLIRYDWRLATLASFGLFTLMFSSHLAEASVAILGGYVLFWFAFNVRSERLSAIGAKVDISYGVYLYAWPIQKVLIWNYPTISPWLVFIETTAIASIIALGSWRLVEQPFLKLKTEFTSGVLLPNPH